MYVCAHVWHVPFPILLPECKYNAVSHFHAPTAMPSPAWQIVPLELKAKINPFSPKLFLGRAFFIMITEKKLVQETVPSGVIAVVNLTTCPLDFCFVECYSFKTLGWKGIECWKQNVVSHSHGGRKKAMLREQGNGALCMMLLRKQGLY